MLAATAISVEHDGETVWLVLPAEPDQIAVAARLCAAETACCSPVRFLLEIAAEAVVLTAWAPAASGLVETLFPRDPPATR